MKVILAQGNPGDDYTKTRHNVGFYCIDHLANELSVTFLPKPKFHADIAEASVDGEKIILVKPATFYNETGHTARALVDFYKLDPASDLLVIHDDLALPFGTIRTRPEGSDAGNNGVKSLNAHIGPQYNRIRVGIYSPLRDTQHDADFVLGKFTREESETLPKIATKVTQFSLDFIRNKLEFTKITL